MAKSSHQDSKRRFLQQQGTLNPRPQRVCHPLFQDSEFFDARDLVQVKYEMLRQVQVEENPVSVSAKAFGFSRPSFYQAQSTFQQNGLPGLVPRKRGPQHAHKLTSEVLDFVQQCRATQPTLRYPQLAEMIHQRFGKRVHPRSIERHMRRRQKKLP